MPVPDRFRRQCRLLRVATLFVSIGLLALLAFGITGAWTKDTLPAVVYFLPALGYLWALWAVQRALADLADGRLFSATVARAMRHVGIGVLAGALTNVFVVTNLSRWIVGGEGSYLHFDLSGIVLGVVGAALVLLARLVDQARALQDELDGIF